MDAWMYDVVSGLYVRETHILSLFLSLYIYIYVYIFFSPSLVLFSALPSRSRGFVYVLPRVAARRATRKNPILRSEQRKLSRTRELVEK